MGPRGLYGGASGLRLAEDNTLVRESWRFEPVEGKERARMFIDHATADLRTDAAWPDLYAEYGRTLANLDDHVAPRLR